ncbi:MAG: hypothetical protein ACOH5I_18390 [Oligoflexus sp.]
MRIGKEPGVGYRPSKFIVIDHDLQFGERLLHVASERGYYVDCYKSMLEIGYLGRFKQYDVAIVNYELGDMTGLEVAEYCEKLLGNLPLILICDDELTRQKIAHARSPAVFRSLTKQNGVYAIMNAAEDAAEYGYAQRIDYLFPEVDPSNVHSS